MEELGPISFVLAVSEEADVTFWFLVPPAGATEEKMLGFAGLALGAVSVENIEGVPNGCCVLGLGSGPGFWPNMEPNGVGIACDLSPFDSPAGTLGF